MKRNFHNLCTTHFGGFHWYQLAKAQVLPELIFSITQLALVILTTVQVQSINITALMQLLQFPNTCR